MNTKQKENTAKYLYDVSNGILIMVIVSSLLNRDLSLARVTLGGLSAIFFFLWAYKIDGGQTDG
jgi:hypothetical protein